MDTESACPETRNLYRTFFYKLLRNYVVGSLLVILIAGSSVVLATLNLPPEEHRRLGFIMLLSLAVMTIVELIVFLRHIKPIRQGLNSGAGLKKLKAAYVQTHRLPLLTVFRILVPHLLGFSVPAVLLTSCLLSRELLNIPVLYMLGACLGALVIAGMHAMLDFFLTTAAIRPLLVDLKIQANKRYQVELNTKGYKFLSIRPKFLISGMLIGTSPLLLFSLVVHFRLQNSDAGFFQNYWSWAGVILIIAAAFTYMGARLITQDIERPISQLYDAMNDIKEGQMTKIPNIYSDEFSKLVSGFNMMVGALQHREKQSQVMLDSYFVALAAALDARDPYTAGHSLRVAEYSELIGRLSGMSSEEMAIIRKSALLHDIGKIGISDTVLLKEGRLTDEEFNQIKAHPILGENILVQIEPKDEMAPLLPGVRSHHERYDGQGYPDGLAGEDIPVLGRIIAVADAYDAMTSDRPYRRGMAPSIALLILEEGKGSQWDPVFAQVFVDHMRAQLFSMRKGRA
ncbi:HD domain-containing protein [Paenibacillus donghaensis]|uniref:HD domain-containing phosphohydrolase n=1 Tax=Paenibacillus donghaensis TaxID=414771 RepID=UPI001883ECD4|nr:HD domain-containing phosphohydrolase [Paenibacillus donghaensis]MBE9917997.1 HD domain-containing protein [Paenibacillus donghaensis]